MNKILISIKPELVVKILSGEKTIEIRKSMPKCELPCEVYIYCSKGKPFIGSHSENGKKIFTNHIFGNTPYYNGKVVAKFTLNKVEKIEPSTRWDFDFENDYEWSYEFYEPEILRKSCLTYIELDDYVYSKTGECYAWHIDNLQIFDKPKELKDFGLNKAPQSWCYVNNDKRK